MINEKIYNDISTDNYDWLGRADFINNFKEMLIRTNNSKHICIDGIWGSGKTTTIHGIIQKLENMSDDNKPMVLYMDAWEFENYEHPLYALIKLLNDEYSDIFKDLHDEVSDSKLKLNLGLSMFGISISSKTDEGNINFIFKEADKYRCLSELSLKLLERIKEEKNNKLILFVDELDRCKPEFAIKTLEIFHHLLSELPIIFVYGTDLNQLKNIIKRYYGENYDSSIFLDKIFDLKISLKTLTDYHSEQYIINKYNSLISGDKGLSISAENLAFFIKKYLDPKLLLSLRTLNKLIETFTRNVNCNCFRMNEFSNPIKIYGQVEILISLQCAFIENPIDTADWLRGRKIEKYYEYLKMSRAFDKVPNYKNFLSELIRFEYNFGKDVIEVDVNNIPQDEIINILKKRIDELVPYFSDMEF